MERLFVTAAPRLLHQKVVTSLSRDLSLFVEARGMGIVLVSPVDVVLSEHDVVEPDTVYVCKERSHTLTDKNIEGAPDLVVEVLSESTAKTDLAEKLDLYSRYGVGEYWVIDPDRPSARVDRRSDGKL